MATSDHAEPPPKCFRPEEWIGVVDFEACPYSQPQIDALKQHDIYIKGLVVCNSAEHRESVICNTIESFPAFCKDGSCVMGTRTSPEALEQMCLTHREYKRGGGAPSDSAGDAKSTSDSKTTA